jgi:hypothetical protein
MLLMLARRWRQGTMLNCRNWGKQLSMAVQRELGLMS